MGSTRMVVLHVVNAKLGAGDRLSDVKVMAHKLSEGLAAASGRLPQLTLTLRVCLDKKKERELNCKEMDIFKQQYGNDLQSSRVAYDKDERRDREQCIEAFEPSGNGRQKREGPY